MFLVRVLLISGLIFIYFCNSFAQIAELNPPELQGIDVIENLGDYLPLSTIVTDHHGKEHELSEYFDDELPVLFVLHYSDCPMLCSLVLNGVSNGVRGLGFRAGIDYKILALSINPEEENERALNTWARYRKTMKPGATDNAWTFLTADSTAINTITSTLGFGYYQVEETGEYAHPAVLHVLSPEGMISRYLYGIEFKERDLRLALVEAGNGKIGNTLDRIILYCFHYDPDAKGYVVMAGNIMRLGGIATLIALGTMIGVFWRKEKRNKP